MLDTDVMTRDANEHSVRRVLDAVGQAFSTQAGRGTCVVHVPGDPHGEEPAQQAVTSVSDVAFDLAARRIAARTVTTIGTAEEQDEGGSGEQATRPVTTIIDDNTLHTALVDGTEEGTAWFAVPGRGFAANMLFPLYWLRGASTARLLSPDVETTASRLGASESGDQTYRVSISSERATGAAQPQDRAGVDNSFDDAGVREIDIDVTISSQGQISSIDLRFPDRDNGVLITTRLDLRDLGVPQDIPLPTDAMQMTVEEFVSMLVGAPNADAFRHWFE